MRYIFIIIAIAVLFVSCNTEKKDNLSQIANLISKLDSVSTEYRNIEWETFKGLQSKIDSNLNFINENTASINLIDANYVQYIGPYATIGKTLNRTFKKRTKAIEKEIDFSHSQLSNLQNDIKHELIPTHDSILYYIQTEHKEVELVLEKINNLQDLLNKQVEAYELTHKRVDSLIFVVKQNIKTNK